MPSGSKKRKSSKKPKTQGDPPELEAGLEGAMGSNEEEVGEAPPSPKGIEGDPEATAERGLEGNKENGEVPQEGDAKPEPPKEDFQTDEAAPDQYVGGQGDSPSQVKPEPEIPTGIEPEAPAVFELEGETAQRETEPQIDTPLMELETETDATPEEIKPELESDAVPVESEPVADATPDASPYEIKPDADVVLDEIESSKESTKSEREFELDAAPIGSDSGMDDSFVETETKTDAASADIEPEIDKAPDDYKLEMDAAPTEDADIGLDEIESSKESTKPERQFELDAAPIANDSGMDESFVETEPKTNATSADTEPEIDKAPDEFKLEMDATPAEVELEIGEPLVQVKPEADAVPYIDLETNEAPDEVSVDAEPETDGAPAEIKPEAEVEEIETAAPAGIEPETEEDLRDRELVTDTASKDVEAKAEGAQVEELESASPAVIEPETEEALMERDLVTDTSPMDVEAEVGEALTERELAIDAATADGKAETDAAPVDTKAERDTARVEADAFHDEFPPEIDAASPENETETDVAARGFASEADRAVVELEPPTEVSSVEIEPEMNAAPDETGHDEVSQAEIKAEPEDVDNFAGIEAETELPQETEGEALVEGKPEVNAEDVDNFAGIKAETELPQETEPELKPLDLTEDTSLEPLQEIEPESEAEAIDEASVGTKAEERGYVETESDQQDFVEGEVEAPPQINPEPEVETTREIALEAEAEVPLEAEPESVVEAPAEVEPDEKGLIETESDQQDLVEIEPDQSGVKEQDQELHKQEGEAEIGELNSSLCEDNQPSESQPQVAIASGVPVIEDEPPAISASDEAISVDDSTSSTSISEASDNTDKERTAIEQEPEKGDEIPPSATALEGEGESIVEVVSENQDSGGDVEQMRATAVDNEQGAADELPAESKDISQEQERAVDVGHDEYGAVGASSGNGGETEESIEQELAIELPPADGVDVEESPKEEVSEQERAVDVGRGEDGAVLASAGNGGEAEVVSELLPADVIDVEELAKEGAPPSDQELVTKQTQLLIDEQDLSMGLGAAVDEPPSVESEQSLNATLSSSETKKTSDAPEPQDEAVTLANEGNAASEHEFNLESVSGELERDLGEEEAASSTVAEMGSVLNDFDDRASCVEGVLPTVFPSTDQDVDIPDCKEFNDILSTEAPASVETVLREQLDSEPPPAEKVDANTVCGLAPSKQEAVLLESAEAAKPAEGLHSELVEEMPSDERLPSLPHPEEVVQESGKDEVYSSKEVVLANEEPRTAEEERAACKDDKVAANSILGTSFPNVAGDELISKAFTYLENGQQSLSSSEAHSNELVEQRNESSIHQSEANNMDKAEIHAMDSKELKEAKHNSMGGDTNNDTDKAPVESASPISEGRDMKGVRTLHQERTREASLPVVIPSQDRALEHVNLKSAERPNGGGTLQRRTKLLDCCGMFDLLLRKN